MNTRSKPKQSFNTAATADVQLRKLSPEEIVNPHLVIQQLFINTPMPDLREALWQWLKLTITGTYTLKDPLERANLVYLYEEMERVLEAVWVMSGE
jgi:hypothetical protein